MKKRLVILLVLSLFFSVTPVLFAESADLEPRYDPRVEVAPGEWKFHSKQLGQTYGTGYVYDPFDDNNTGEDCFFTNFLYYMPASGALYPDMYDGWDEDTSSIGGYEDILKFSRNKFPFDFIKHLCLQTGDTIVIETQTNAIGIYSADIYAERDGEWMSVASESVETKSFNEGTYIIQKYKISDNDSRVKTVSHFHIERNKDKKPSDDEFVTMIDVGTARKYLTHFEVSMVGGILVFGSIAAVIIVKIRREKLSREKRLNK